MFISFSTLELGHISFISLKVLPSQPALVAKGIIFFPSKLKWFKKVLIAGTGRYHHTGVPKIIVSYLSKSTLISCISGKWLLDSLFCSSFTTES